MNTRLIRRIVLIVLAGGAKTGPRPARPGRCRRRFLAGLLCLGVLGLGMQAATARAHSYKVGEISIGHIWAPPPGKSGDGLPVYGPIVNNGKARIDIIELRSPVAKRVRIRLKRGGGVVWRDGLRLEPGRPVALAPWREHIWLEGIDRGKLDRGSFDLMIGFSNGTSATVRVLIEAPPAQGGTGATH